MRLLWSYIARYKGVLFAALIFAVVNQGFALLDPQIFRIIIDDYASKFSELERNDFISGVGLLVLASMGVAFISRVAKNFQDYFVTVVTERVSASLYEDNIRHSFSLPYLVFEDQRSGELLQKLQRARIDVQRLIRQSINIVFISLVGMFLVLAYAFYVHWLIGLVYGLIIPILGVTLFLIIRKVKVIQSEIVRQTADLAGSTTETLRNVELVKSLGLERQETLRLNDVNSRILNLELKKAKLVRFLMFFQGTSVNAARSGILFLMMVLIVNASISLGEFFSLLFYSFAIFNPLSEFGAVANQYQETRASMEHLERILDIPPEPKPTDPILIKKFDNILFDNVSFAYSDGSVPAVSKVTANIKAGQTVAFVGPSGSGKSTILKLLVGLYRPSDGEMRINGHISTQIDFDTLREHIGYVSQDTQLFSGTIRENLLFVRPDASDEECKVALKAAAAESIMDRGGQGLDTKIGEGGVKVSGGERQRLSIARSILREPSMIIFDEATSSLDSITERSVTETIRRITKAMPTLINILVAHRLSTVAHADVIYVLAKGKIVEYGTHVSLLENDGLYAALWQEQQANT